MNSWFTTIDKYHLTKSIAYQHNFRPYIDRYNNFIYVQNYPLLQGKDFRNNITVETFTRSLLRGIEELRLENIYIAGHSCGGLMALEASKNPRVEKVVATASPIFPTLFADTPRLDELYKQGKLKKEEFWIYALIKMYVNYDYGYTQNHAKGCVDRLETLADWKKSMLIYGSIAADNPKGLLEKAAAMIERIDSMPNDGIVGFKRENLKDYPWKEINYGSHFDLVKEDIVNTEYNILINDDESIIKK